MRKVLFEVPSCGIKFTGTLRDGKDQEPEMAQNFWEFIEKPVKFFSHPTLSTGDLTVLFPRPPIDPPKYIGDQTSPISEKSPILCSGDGELEVRAGEFIWCGWNVLFCYGPSCTEPLESGGAYVLQVDEECLDALEVAREDLWNHTFLYHKCGTITISRLED